MEMEWSPSDDVNNNDRPAAHSTETGETCPAQLNSSETEVGQPSGDDNDKDRPAAHSTGSGLALLAKDGWLEIAQFLDFYSNAILRFASAALNRLISRYLPTLPLRVVECVAASIIKKGYIASAFEGDQRNPWRDLVCSIHESPEPMLREILTKCSGLAIAELDLQHLPYNEQVLAVLAEGLQSVSVSKVVVDGVASGHENVHRLLEMVRGLHNVVYQNDEHHANAAAVLIVCAARNIPAVTLRFAADVTEEQIIAYLFGRRSPRITRQLGIPRIRRSLSEHFFEMIVEKCQRHECQSLRFGMSDILTDPTDAKYERFVVERDDNGALYRFGKTGQAGHAFSILVGTHSRQHQRHYFLRVFQGDANELCSSLAAAMKIRTCYR